MRHAAEKLNDFNGRIRIVEPLSYASDTVTAHRRMVWTADNPESSDFRMTVKSWNQRSSSACSTNARTAPAAKSDVDIETSAARVTILAASAKRE
jgi:hypothetical protein